MATQVKHRRGTTSEIDNFTPAVGELVVDTTTNELILGDGSTQGGKVISSSKQVDTVAVMKTRPFKPDDLVMTKGYTTKGDGGSGVYLIKPNETVDGVTDHLLNNGNVAILQEGVFYNKKQRGQSSNTLTVLAAAVRRSAGVGGSWSFIDDADHKPVGFTTVTEPDDFSYQVNYENEADKIGTIISVIDKELAPYGIHTGAQGGVGNGIFSSYAPCVLYIEGLASLSASPLWTSQTGPISVPNIATITMTHANRALAVDPPVLSLITPVAGSHHCNQYQLSWTATTTTITGLDDVQGLCQYNGANPVISSSPNLNISASINAGSITITHDDAIGNFIPQLTAFNSPLRPEIQSMTATTIVVQFRDATGAVVNAPTTDMKFYFRRASLVASAIDAGCRFGIDLGLCRVKNDDVGNVSLNNYWLVGLNGL